MTINFRRILSQVALITGAVLFSIGLQTFAAFSQPSTSPPNADAYAPLTVSPSAQSKAGGLLLNTGAAVNGLIVQNGNVGIGSAQNLLAKLDVQGNIRIADGTQGAGKVLTSNADGVASWSSSAVPPGTWCGMEIGFDAPEYMSSILYNVPCGSPNYTIGQTQSQEPLTCPAGYYKQTFGRSGDGGQSYTCIKS